MCRSFSSGKEQKEVPGRGNNLNKDTEVRVRAVRETGAITKRCQGLGNHHT